MERSKYLSKLKLLIRNKYLMKINITIFKICIPVATFLLISNVFCRYAIICFVRINGFSYSGGFAIEPVLVTLSIIFYLIGGIACILAIIQAILFYFIEVKERETINIIV